MTMTIKRTGKLVLEFGYSAGLPLCVPFAWGARAIFNWPRSANDLERGRFDIPYDRRGSAGEGFTAQRQAMMDTLNQAKALDALAKATFKAWDDRSIEQITSFEEAPLVTMNVGMYTLQAKLQGGYIYLSAFPNPTHTAWARAYQNVGRDLVQAKHPEAWADHVPGDNIATGIYRDSNDGDVTPALIAADVDYNVAWIEAANKVWA